jgi:hypothetical protein
VCSSDLIIRERDRFIYEETDEERAASLGMTVTEYYDKFGIPVDPYKMEIVDFNRLEKTPTNGRVRQRDGTIFTYRNGILVNKEKPVEITKQVMYDPALERQPDGEITMPDGSVRTYKNGRVIKVNYPAGTPASTALTPDQINVQEGNLSYEQLKTKYPDAYQSLLKKYAGDPDADAKIEETLLRGHKTGLYNPNPVITNPDGSPIQPDREPTYEELQVMYPDKYQQFLNMYASGNKFTNIYSSEDKATMIEALLRSEHTSRLEDGTAAPLPAPVTPVTPETPVTPVTPVPPVLFNGERKMPDGTIRFYKNGKIVTINYPEGFLIKNMLDAKGIKALNKNEGDYYDPNPPTPETPTESSGEPLKNGIVNMPDGSTRTYKDGLVVTIAYSNKTGAHWSAKTPAEINAEEGVRNATYTGAVTPEPVAPTKPLQQGYVKMPDGSKRMYIDGLVVSVEYPPGVNGPTLHEINAAEGTKEAAPRIENPMDAVDDFFKGKTPREPVAPVTPEPEPSPLEDDVILGNRLDTLMGRPTAPAPGAPTSQTTQPTRPTPPTGVPQGVSVQDSGPLTGAGQGYSSTQTNP